MQLASQRISLAMMAVALGLTVATVLVVPTGLIPYWLVAVGALTAFITYAVLGSPLAAVLVWFATLAFLHEEFARLILPGFFNLTIPRVLLVVLVVLFIVMVAVGRVRTRWAHPAGLLMLAILAYFTVSAFVSGFQTIAIASVHYRLIAGYWFPFIIFALMVQAIRTDLDVRRVLYFFLFLGLYLTFIGWAEHFKLWQLVWPSFIADPSKGIHWGRVRGPFLASPIMGLTMVYVFFNNLVLARTNGTVLRLICRLAAAATLPVIFWTQTRSVWLALLAAGALWVALSRRGLSRGVWLSAILAVSIAGAAYNWRDISSTRREAGGVTSVEPIYVRLGLFLITRDMFFDRPVLGVGFGHFRDHAMRYAHNPSSPYYAFASSAMEHNNFLSIVAECGLVGLALYLWLLIVLLKASIRLYRRLPPMGTEPVCRDIVVLYWVLYLDFFIDAMFRETSVSPFANALFFGLSGVIFALDYLLGPEPLPEEASSGAHAPASPPRALSPA